MAEEPARQPRVSGAGSDEGREGGAAGAAPLRLRSTSRIRLYRVISVVVLGVLGAIETVWLLGSLYGWLAEGRFAADILWQGTTVLIAWLALRLIGRREWRLHGHQKAVAEAVRTVASARDWDLRRRDEALEQGWSRPPFAQLRNAGASPSARGDGPYGESGVAYLEGDVIRRGTFPTVFTSRLAWTTLPGALPTIHFVREGWANRLAVALGGRDVDVESDDFNRRWRVLTDDPRAAHAVLSPAVIDILNGVADLDLALTFDGGRALVWDDSSDADVELGARLVLVERLVRAIPDFVVTREA